MATRMFCDQCGNTIRESHKASCYIGPVLTMHDPSQQHAINQYNQAVGVQNAQHLGAGSGSYSVMAGNYIPTTSATTPFLSLDLCNTCVKSWPERVKHLTRMSDPDVKTP